MPLLSNAHTSESLSESEFETLHGLLTLHRQSGPWLRLVLDQAARVYGRRGQSLDAGQLVGIIAEKLDETTTEDVAGLFKPSGPGLETLTGSEVPQLQKYLDVIRRGSWLQSFIGTLCSLHARGEQITPLDAARVLDNDADQFQTDVEIAERMVRDYPGLFRGRRQERIEDPDPVGAA